MLDKILKMLMGKEMALAITVLRIVSDAAKQLKVERDNDLSISQDPKFVDTCKKLSSAMFQNMPKEWKESDGGFLNESELNDLILTAVPFVLAIKNAVTKQEN